MKTRKILSLGAGVQSSLMALAMTDKYKIDKLNDILEGSVVIFADTGSERPETIQYFNEIIEPELKASNIEYYVVKTHLGKLHEHYTEKRIMPFRVYRSCTDQFKVIPIREKITKDVYSDRKRGEKIIMYLGITTDEATRMKKSKITWWDNKYPLIDLDLSRDNLFDIYRKWGIEPPVKSGCFMCPFQKRTEIIQLYYKHPKLLELTIKMEENAIKYENIRKKETKTLLGKIENKQSVCDTCKTPINTEDWYMICIDHLIKEHVNCKYSDSSNHNKCKSIEETKYNMQLLAYGETVRETIDNIKNEKTQTGLDDFGYKDDECSGTCFT